MNKHKAALLAFFGDATAERLLNATEANPVTSKVNKAVTELKKEGKTELEISRSDYEQLCRENNVVYLDLKKWKGILLLVQE